MQPETTEELNQSETGDTLAETAENSAYDEYAETVKAKRKEFITASIQVFLEELGQIEFNEVLRTASEQARAAIAERKRIAHEQANAILVAAGLPPVNISQQTAHAQSSTKPSGTNSTVAVKYRDPSNPANTWTGRGKKPLWLTALLEQGHKIEEFSV